MFKSLFRKWRYRRMAAQLRHPKGKKGTLTGEMMNQWNRHMYAFTLAEMKIQDGEKVLEIGFGNGHFFPLLAEAGPSVQLYGLEQSERMIRDALTLNQDLIRQGRLELKQGLAQALPWPDDFFDRIFCINVIYFWDNPQPVLQEIKRVMKPGGQFYATCRSKENMAQLPFTKWQFSTYHPEEWEAELQKAGWVPRKSTRSTEPGMQESGVDFRAEQFCVSAMKK